MVSGILTDRTAASSRSRAGATWEFTLPAALDFSDLPPRDRQLADEEMFFASTVLRKTVYRKTDDDGYARLSTNHLRSVVRRRTLPAAISDLERRDAIEVDQSYWPGHYSRGYRLTERQLRSGHVRIRPSSPGLVKRLCRFQDDITAIQAERRKPIHDALHAIQLESLHIVKGDAERILRGLEPAAKLCQGILVENLLTRRLGNSVGRTGRWFNGITGLKRELRNALRLAGEAVGAMDIRCAQPGLLGMQVNLLLPPVGVMYKRPTYKVLLPAYLHPASLEVLAAALVREQLSCKRFVELVSSGEFYEELALQCGLSVPDAKHQFIVYVLAPKGNYPNDVRRTFADSYPGVAAFVEAVNRPDYRTMIRLLQQLESWLVIETVAPRLVEKIPIVTLHDAIYGRASDVPQIEQAFKETFDSLGYRLALRPEFHGPKSTPPIGEPTAEPPKGTDDKLSVGQKPRRRPSAEVALTIGQHPSGRR